MNNHFVNITKKLKSKPRETETKPFTLLELVQRYKDYQGKIRSQMNDENNFFSFKLFQSKCLG